MFFSVVLVVAATAIAASTNSSTTIATSTVFDSGVPTDAPVPGDYTGKIIGERLFIWSDLRVVLQAESVLQLLEHGDSFQAAPKK